MGQVEAIHVAPSAGAAMQPLPEVAAVAGVGLAGDRYFTGLGFYSNRPTDPGAREVTLFEAEVLDRLRAEHGIVLRADEHRRNLTTRGVVLGALLGQRFRVGEVLLEGVKDCPPCEHLEQLVSQAVLKPLVKCGGLRARVLEGGTIRVGDVVRVAAQAAIIMPAAAAPVAPR
jgi:MOSC domain-containing protein YiiM